MGNLYKTEEEMGAHPGWAIQFSDGTWLGGAHGWFRSDEAFYADRHETKEDAERNLTNARYSEPEYYNLEYKVVPAWEPLCESLRVRIRSLTEANKISPRDLDDAVFNLEQVIDTLKGKS